MLDDATPQQIAKMAAHVIGNTGQSCNALSRLIVPRSRQEECIQIAKEVFENVTISPAPMGKLGDIGPLASKTQFDKVTGYIRKGIEEGARLVTGGPDRPDGDEFSEGYFVRPTVFADVDNDMTIAREEIFGPVLAIIPADSESEAIDICNDTIFGLNNGVASSSMERAMAVAAQPDLGRFKINTPSGGAGINVLFGGYKQSGDGREWGKSGWKNSCRSRPLISRSRGGQNCKPFSIFPARCTAGYSITSQLRFRMNFQKSQAATNRCCACVRARAIKS